MNASVLRQIAFLTLAAGILLAAGMGVTTYRDSQKFSVEKGASPMPVEPFRDVVAALRDAEASQRSFVLTGAAASRQSYVKAVERAGSDKLQIEEALRRGGAEQAGLKELPALITQRLAQLKWALEARRFSSGNADGLNQRLAALVAQSELPGSDVADDALARAAAYARESWTATIIGCVLLVLLLGGALYALYMSLVYSKSHVDSLKRNAEYAGEVRDQWRTTLLSMEDAVIAADAEGRITLSNQAAQALTGWSRQACANVPLDEVFQLVHADTREPLDSPLHAGARAGEPGGRQDRTLLVRRDGTRVPIETSTSPIRDGDGTMRGVVLVFRDVTARWESEAEAAKQARCCQDMLDSLGDGVAALDEKFQFVYANPQARALLGLAGDLAGRVLWQEIPGLGNSRFGKNLIRAMRDRAALRAEEEFQGRALAVQANPAAHGLTLQLSDVTGQQTSSCNAVRNQERIHRSLRAAGAATWEYDVAARRMEWSDSASELFGGAQAAATSELAERVERGTPSDFRIVHNGEERWLTWAGQAIPTENGEPQRVTGVLMDVTSRRRPR